MPHRPGLALLLALLGLTAASAEAALDEHGGPVKGVAVSADGTQALTASFDYSIILWSLPDQTVQAHLYGHDAAVNDVAFLADDRALSASDDGTVGLWDLRAHELIARLPGHEGKVTAIAVSPDGRLGASAGWDGTVRIWDLDAREQLHQLRGSDNLNTVRFTPDGQRLFAGASDGNVIEWRVEDGTQLMVLNGHDFAVTSIDLAPDGQGGVTASIDETVQIWDLETAEAGTTLFGHEGPVLAVALSPDGELVASGGVDGTVRVWRRGDGDRLRVYDRHHGAVWSVAFTPDGETLLSGGADGLVVTYDLDQEPEDETTTASPGPRVAALTEVDVDDGSRGAELFRACAACHTVTPDGGHRAGPTLHHLFGRTAGTLPGYSYSSALRESDLVWTEETVSRLFEIGPDQLVPGSKMPLQRMPNDDDREQLIDYLKRVTVPDRQD